MNRTDQRPPTIDDVAARAKVSRATVSKVMSPMGRIYQISQATRTRVLQAASALGYTPDAQVSLRSRQRSRHIGLAYCTGWPFLLGVYESLAEVVAEHLAKQDLDLLFVPLAHGTLDWQRLRRDQTLDGVLFVDRFPQDVEDLIRDTALPRVVLNWAVPMPVDAVLTDDTAGMALAIEHLVGLGHRRIRYCITDERPANQHPSVWLRQQALESLAKRLPFTWEAVAEGIDPWTASIGRDGGPTALIAHGERVAMEIAHRLHRDGRQLGRAVSLLCCHDSRALGWYSPGITAVRIPMDDMARQAVDLLLKRLAGEASAPGGTQVVLPQHLVVRGSTGPVSTG